LATPREDFEARVRELLAFIHHVERQSQESPQDDGPMIGQTLRAAAYLMTYNMVEATARNVVCAIFDRLSTERVSFDEVRTELKSVILRHARQKNPDELAPKLLLIATDIFIEAFDAEQLFGGNVDARELRKTAKMLGYSEHTHTDGAALLTIKTNRNDLAHGHKTFSELGRDVSVSELRQHVARAVWYMRAVLRNVEAYLVAGEYLAYSQSNPAGAE
jgi:hypothetical protein